MLILELLRHAAAATGTDESGRVANALCRASDREFQWAIEAGLGPLLLHSTGGHADGIPDRWHEMLLSSELTARLRHGLHVDTATEVIDVCAMFSVPVTLLKGISISEQYYPQGHMRAMSDVDVLLPTGAHPVIETELLRRGYERGHEDPDPREDPHHGAPLLDRNRQVWVELHKELFPGSSGLRAGRAFSASNVSAHSVPSKFHGREVRRLSNEFQAVYLAASWIWDLTIDKFHPSLVRALFDVALLQRVAQPALDWNRALVWLDNQMGLASLHVMLSYLARHGLCAVPPPGRLARTQRLVGPIELPITHAVLDHYLLDARTWNLPFPPPVPGRYNLRRQFRKRILRSQ